MRIKKKPNFSDKILAATFLKILPKRITPNQITIFRFFTIPFIALFISMEMNKAAIILFVVSAFSDALDGALARTKNKITKWGIIYDPLADKLLIGITAFLILPKYIEPLLVFLMIFLEMILIGSAYHRANQGEKVKMANWWGKSKMIAQCFSVGFVMLYIFWPLSLLLLTAQWMWYAAIALSVISISTYSL